MRAWVESQRHQSPSWHEESAQFKPVPRVSDDHETFDTYEPGATEAEQAWEAYMVSGMDSEEHRDTLGSWPL